MNNVLSPTFSKEIANIEVGLTAEKEFELITIAKNGFGDVRAKARNKLLESQLKQIVAIARSYSNNLNPVSELVSIGAIGFDTAINKFDLSKGVRFFTYYRFWVRDAINQSVHSNHLIRPPMNIAKTNSKTEEELALLSKGNKRKIGDTIHIGYSMSTPMGDDGKTTLEDTIQSDECIETTIHNKLLIRKAIKGLDRKSREWQIIKLHHIDGLGLDEIGTKYGITKQAISANMLRTLEKMRKRLQ